MPTMFDNAARRDRRVRCAISSQRVRTFRGIVHAVVALIVTASFLQSPSLANTNLDQLRAEMLFNFIKMADWPASSTTEPVHVLVVGDDEFADVLSELLSTRSLGKRKFTVSTGLSTTSRDAMPFHVLVLGTRAENAHEIVANMLGRPVLTVSLEAELVKYGCMLGTDRVRGKLRFDVNREAERQSGLKLSSRLLSLARKLFDDIQDQRIVVGRAE